MFGTETYITSRLHCNILRLRLLGWLQTSLTFLPLLRAANLCTIYYVFRQTFSQFSCFPYGFILSFPPLFTHRPKQHRPPRANRYFEILAFISRKWPIHLSGRARAGPGSTDNVRVRAGFLTGSNDSNQTLYRIFRAFSGHSYLAKKRLFVVALMLCS
jgi:hypothetical protein